MRFGVAFLLFFSGVVGQRRPARYNGPPCNPRYYNCNYPPPREGYPQGPSRSNTYPQAIGASQPQAVPREVVIPQQFPPATPIQTAQAAASYQAYVASLQNPLPPTTTTFSVPVPAPSSTGIQYLPQPTRVVATPFTPPLQYSPAAGQYPPAPSTNPLYDITTPARPASFIVPGGASSTTTTTFPPFGVPVSSPISQTPITFPSSTIFPQTFPSTTFPNSFPTTTFPQTLPSSTFPTFPTFPLAPTTPVPTPAPAPTFPLLPRSQVQYSPVASPSAVYIQCGTTKGPFRLRIEPDWAPLGAARFLSMVDQGFFTDIAFFRVVPNFLVQFGLAATPELQAKWSDSIQDDPHIPGMPFKRGMLSFAASGPNTRTSQLFIAFQDSTSLGTQPWETPFGDVEEMSVIDSIYSGYGDMQAFGGRGPDSAKIAQYGNTILRQQYPLLDYINYCQRVTPYSPTSQPTTKPTPLPRLPSLPVFTPTPFPTFPTKAPTAKGKAPTIPPTFPPTIPPTLPPTRPPTFAPTFAAPAPTGKGKAGKAVQNPNVPLPASMTLPPSPFDPLETLPRCDNMTCGSAIATDPEGKTIVCSCHENCVRDKMCCRDFLTVCPKQAELAQNIRLPNCIKEACGKALMEGGNPLCSCHENCVNRQTCCPEFEQSCPAEFARAATPPLVAANGAVVPGTAIPPTPDIAFAPTGNPKCTQRDCNFAFMNEGTLLCSCAKGCEEAGTCCDDYQSVCNSGALPPACTYDVCGSEFRAKNSSELLCSCHSSCVAANTCCVNMADFCPEQLALARHTAATALLAGASPVAPVTDLPKCEPATCGADFANDPEGNDVICSCFWECHAEGTCCEGFESQCPDEFALATKAEGEQATGGKGGKGKAGKGKA